MNKIEQIKAEIERLKEKYRQLIWSEDSEKSKEGGYKIELLNELMLSLPEDEPSSWKPSEEQMEALKYALGEGGKFDKAALNSLYSDLKKL